jgi:hypothetical protein
MASTKRSGANQVLANVVHVALDGAHDERADRLDAGFGQERAQHVECTGHGPTGDQHLGHEEVAAFKPRPHLFERGDERVEQQRLGVQAHLESGSGEVEHDGGIADQGRVVHLLEQLISVHAAPSLFCR